MKKIHILGAAVMALAMTACDNEPQVRPGSNEKPAEIAGKFIGITIKNADVNSRAISGPAYQEGTPDENALADGKLHFLFFDEAGLPFPMTGTNINGTVKKDEEEATNWVKPVQVGADLVNNAGDVTTAQADAVLILGNGTGSYEGMIPSRVICVANVDDDFIKQNYAMKSIEELLEENSNAATSKAPLHTEVYTTDGDKKTNFVMTSSSWCTGTTDNLSTVCWSDITYDNICDDSKAALANPVNIYIERLAAKVSVTSMPESAVVMENATKTLEIQINELDGDGNVVLSEAKNVIAVPTGWDVNTVSAQTYGIKHLLDGRPVSKYFLNASDFSIGVRSFWASTSSINQVQDFTPTNLSHKAGETIYTLANTKDPFLQGNGSSGVDNLRGRVNFARCYATKVLVGVNFYVVDAGTTTVPEGMQPTEFMYWGGMYYTPEALCAVLGRGMEDGQGVAYARNTEDNIHYQVKFYEVSYKSGLVGKNISGNQAAYDPMSVPAAECWSGMGYYIVNIANGITNTKATTNPTKAAGSQMYGVLRNTSYNYEIENFIGLGTPVPVTDDVTRVENPEETETYVAAKLNILNWRVLSTKVTLQ